MNSRVKVYRYGYFERENSFYINQILNAEYHTENSVYII